MATFDIQNDQLILQFSMLEKFGGLRLGARVELKDIKSVEVIDNPWNIIEGLRVGTGICGIIALGTMLRLGLQRNDIVAVYKKKPAVVITLQPGASYHRLIFTVPHPEQVVASIQKSLKKKMNTAKL